MLPSRWARRSLPGRETPGRRCFRRLFQSDLARVFLPQSRVFSAWMTFARDATFSLGATESSRSRNTRSALLPAAFSIRSGAGFLAPIEGFQRVDDLRPRCYLLVGRDGVFQVEKHQVGAASGGFFNPIWRWFSCPNRGFSARG